jgi:hypothetical protein
VYYDEWLIESGLSLDVLVLALDAHIRNRWAAAAMTSKLLPCALRRDKDEFLY